MSFTAISSQAALFVNVPTCGTSATELADGAEV